MEGPSLDDLAASFVSLGVRLYFDVSPLFDEHWTGIPTVAAGLADALLTALPENTGFFYRQDLVATAAVQDALRRESGLYLERGYHRGQVKDGPVPLASRTKPTVGIYPSVKLERALFPIECSLYHDISTLILPQYHTMENIRHHLLGMTHDIATNAMNFGVSHATIDDMVNYLGAERSATHLARNGHSWPWWFAIQEQNEPSPGKYDPYFVVLGTREPRKNLVCVFEALELFPEILQTHRLLVVGKEGWLTETARISRPVRSLVDQGRIHFTGYVSNYQKYCLLKRADATIYPSLFEGFGLPIVESLSVGTPCIVSWSSAMPDTGGKICFYFDPISPESLASAILLFKDRHPRKIEDLSSRLRNIAETHTWSDMLKQILFFLLQKIKQVEG